MENSAPYAGTTYTAYTDRILANGEFLVANSGYTITACKVFNGEQETEFHANLAFDSYHLAGDATTYYQLQFVKNDATAFTVDELSQVVRLYRRKPIVWNANSHIDRFITPGTYSISGQRTNVADGLPIANAASGHTLHARLVVLDSSITGSGKASDKCITQILTLSNRVGGDGNIYVRTGRAASEGQLACGNGWGTWGKLQQNIEVGQIASLDGYVDNGIYSGVYTNGTTFFETFVMLVLNNYAVAAATGAARSITQVKYAVDIDGTFSYKVRTGQGTDTVEWGDWRDPDSVITTNRIQDGAVEAHKLSADVREKVEKIPSLEKRLEKEKTALVNGDTIVGLSREVYSRQGKTDTATFLMRTTAGGTSISDGVASIRQIGGNIVKNLVDGTFVTGWLPSGAIYTVYNGIVRCETQDIYAGLMFDLQLENGRQYYISGYMYCADSAVQIGAQSVANSRNTFSFGAWGRISYIASSDLLPRIKMTANKSGVVFYAAKPLVIDLTEMFGAGNEPSKEECDKMFGTMDALPHGLTVANPVEFRSIGYNQWNPTNVFTGKTITDNTIVDGDESIAFIECLPCKIGAGENNGYVIGYGEGEEWSDAGIEVYLTPIYPMTSDGLLYAHKLEKDAATGTYVPQIKGYMLIVTPVTDKLCAHFLWSGDRAMTDYEPYIESNISLPNIQQMSEWGLAGMYINGELVQDVIDLENNRYIKRIGKNADGFYPLEVQEEYTIVTKTAPNYIGSDYGVEEFVGSKVPLVANILFYMRSLVSETRNFLDRLMAGLGVSDITAVADRIIATLVPKQTPEPVLE